MNRSSRLSRLSDWWHTPGKPVALVLRLVAAYFLAQSFQLLFIPVSFSSLAFVQRFSWGVFLCVFAVSLALLWFISVWRFSWYSEPLAVGVSTLCYGLITVWRRDDLYYALGVIAVLALIGYFVLRTGVPDQLPQPGRRLTWALAAVAAVALAAFIGVLTVLRYRSYVSSCFDFGIFSQMFHYMKTTLLPLTTCERDGLLSHFAVHVSPIFYVLLPIYLLFPDPATLQISQALVLASGVIPMILLCRHFHLSNRATLCLVFAYCLFPALSGGCFYDIHENKFLAPLLLWLMYAVERKKWIGTFIVALLVMLVKEDAPVYVACVGLFVWFNRKDTKHGLLLFSFSLLYFALVTGILSAVGQGVMTYRYDNFITDPSQGLVGVIYTCVTNPAYVIEECFNLEKTEFLLKMLVPLGFLPLACRKLSQWWLLIPFVLINLMSDYPYQHSIMFQYTYGVMALFFYLTVVNTASLRTAARRYWLSFAAMASAVCFCAFMAGQLWYVDYYREYRDRFTQIDTLLDTIPEDASVEATTYYVPRLSQRDTVYMSVATASVKWEPTDYVVLQVGPSRENFVDERIADLLAQGYQYDSGIDNVIAIYRYLPPS